MVKVAFYVAFAMMVLPVLVLTFFEVFCVSLACSPRSARGLPHHSARRKKKGSLRSLIYG